jgi:hypothetical protein
VLVSMVHFQSIKLKFFAFSLVFFLASIAPSVAESVSGAFSPPMPEDPQRSLRKSQAKNRLNQSHALKIILVSPTASELAEKAATLETTPIQIGFNRAIPASQGELNLGGRPEWQEDLDGGAALYLEVISPDAMSVRIALSISKVPDNALLTFIDAEGDILEQISGRQVLKTIKSNERADHGNSNNRLLWSPVFDGGTARVEVYLPSSVDKKDVVVHALEVSHLYYSPKRGKWSETKASGSCNIDVTCSGSSYSDIKGSVAKMVWTTNEGSFICTGTMLNNSRSDFEPYFLSANHCISAQAAASTLTTHWNYESSACGNTSLSASYRQVAGGAQLLSTSYDTDSSLFYLNGSIDNIGIYFAGWSTLLPQTDIYGIHHPSGDLKKISFGSVVAYSARYSGGNLSPSDAAANFLKVTWSQGTTESGSSGSAIFSGVGVVAGTLLGGGASCTTRGENDWYGRFDRAYKNDNWQVWLNPPEANKEITVRKIGDGSGTIVSTPEGINCGSDCESASLSFGQATTVTLTATAQASSIFNRWEAGSCDAIIEPNECVISSLENRTAYADFIKRQPPSTPQITNTDYGNEEIYLTVSVTNDGSSPITSYTATCTDGNAQYTGTSGTSRITVSGLTNDVSYTCSVTATNAAGTSTSSASSPSIVPEYVPVGLPIWLLYEASNPASP